MGGHEQDSGTLGPVMKPPLQGALDLSLLIPFCCCFKLLLIYLYSLFCINVAICVACSCHSAHLEV